MNKTYRLIWNELTRAWVAVAETVKGRGKRASGAVLLALLAAVLPAPTFAQIAANALPGGGQIVGGERVGSITQSGATMTVNQISDRMIANWQSFNIGKDAAVRFIQPSSNSAALNRVLDGGAASQILGKLSANGQVYLVNPAGVVFGKGSQIDVAGLVATSQKLADADFMARLNKFTHGGAGAVINEGKITLPPGGLVAFIAPVVRNSGEINAPQGAVVLAAASEVDIDFAGDGLVSVRVKQSALDHLAENSGLIQAAEGTVILTAGSAKQLLAGAVNNSGVIEAQGITRQGGKIVLDGGKVTNTGTLDVSSQVQPGGRIEVSGKTVELGGTLDASGSTGGSIKAEAIATLKVVGNLIARGLSGRGGEILLKLAERLELFPGARLDASGATAGGRIDLGDSATLELKLSAELSAVGETAEGGEITLAAHDISLDNATLDASGATRGGRIAVRGATTGGLLDPANPLNNPLAPPETPPTVALTGNTSLRSSSRRGTGGAIDLSGERIGLFDASFIDATGVDGGTVRVGGGWQGSGDLPQAGTVVMGENAVIDVSATSAAGKVGAGGTAVLWSDVHRADGWTGFYGTIKATGANAGAGGQVETSGHQLDAQGSVDAGGGLWLLDPYDVTITTTTSNGTYASHTFTPSANTATVAVSSITSSLNAGNSVTINTTGAGTQTGNITVSSAIATGTSTGTRSLTLNAVGHINLNAAISNSTGTFDLVLNAGGGISGTGNISGTGATTFNVGSSPLGSYSGIISGTRSLTKAGAGLVYLTGANTYTGITTISAGTLQIGGGLLVGTLGSGSVTNNAALIFNRSNALTVSNLISGSGTVEKLGAGTLTLSGANTYDGATTVTAGTLAITHANALGNTAAGTTVASGATLDLQNVTVGAEAITLGNNATLRTSTGTSSLSGAINLVSSGTVDVDGTQLTLSGVVSGYGGILIKTGAGTLTLSGANTYNSGGTYVNAGTLYVTHADALSTGGLVLGASTLRFGATTDLGTRGTTLTGSGTINVDSGYTVTLGGVITDDANTYNLTKSGTGTLVLGGANTYDGATTVSAGKLAITHTNGLGSITGATTVYSGATLDLRNISSAEDVTMNVGGTLQVSTGSSTLSGTLTRQNATGDVTLDVAAGATLSINGGATNGAAAADAAFAGYLLTGGGDFNLGTASVVGDFDMITIGAARHVTIYESADLSLRGTSSLTGNLTARATASIELHANASITTAGGYVLFNAHTTTTQVSNISAILLDNGSSITTNGGNITMGGGAAGDGSGYATTYTSTSDGSIVDIRGIEFGGTGKVTLDAGGGNITLRGAVRSGSQYGDHGILINTSHATLRHSLTTSGTGTITLDGNIASATGELALGVYLGAVDITTTNGALSINASSADTYGIYLSNADLSTSGGNLSLTSSNSNIYFAGATHSSLSAGGSGNILLKAADYIWVNNSTSSSVKQTFTTQGGKITFWSDSDANTTGNINLGTYVTLTSNGGLITLAGGLDNGATTVVAGRTSGDGVPDGYAADNADTGIHLDDFASLVAGSGSIDIFGKSTSSGTGTYGVTTNNGTSLTGADIRLVGWQSSTGGGAGVYLHSTVAPSGSLTATNSISITGTAAGATQSALAVLGVSHGSRITLRAPSITLVGAADSGSPDAAGVSIAHATIEVSAAGGSGISITGTNGTGGTGISVGQALISGAGYNGTVYLTDTYGSGITLDGTGKWNKGVYLFTDGTYTTSVSTTGNLSISGSTTDNIANDEGVDIHLATVSAAGHMTLTGTNASINSDLTVTGAGKNLLLKFTGNIVTGAATSGDNHIYSTNGGNITFWSDSDANGAGNIDIGRYNRFTSNGGHVTLAGGADDGGSTVTTGRASGDGRPDGWAISTGTAEGVRLYDSVINAGSGNVDIFGKQTATTDGYYGVLTYSTTANLTQISGANISLVGNAASRNGVQVSFDDATTITATGSLTLTGTTSKANYSGVMIGSANPTTLTAPTLTITGTNTQTTQGTNLAGSGVSLYNATLQTTAGGSGINITGTNASGNGVSIGLFNNGTAYAGAVSILDTFGSGISITGTGQGSGSNNRFGIRLGTNGTTVQGAGAITLTGTGGNSTAYANGVMLLDTAQLKATASGTISITGTGGQSAASHSNGVLLFSGTPSVTSDSGSISITGVSRGTGGTNADGIWINVGSVTSTGGGAITLTGTGGSATATSEYGLRVTSAGALATTGNVSLYADTFSMPASALAIAAHGHLIVAPLSTSASFGAAIDPMPWLAANSWQSVTIGKEGNTGMITMSGSSASNVLGPIRVYASGSGGDIIVTGNLVTVPAASGAGEILLKADDALAITHASAGQINAGNVSNITLRGKTLAITSVTGIIGTANLYIEPATASTTIGVGSLSASGTLRLPQSYFWNGTTGSVKNGFGNIFIGRSDGTGSITVGNLTYTDPLTLQNYGSNSATISIIGTVSNAGNSTNSGHFKALAGGETYVSASTTITTYADILINSASYDGTVAATHGISLVGTTLNSNGGAIRLGGGTARDGSGYSTNGNIAYNGIRIATDPSTINSGGGDISIRAQSANNVAMALESGSAALSVNSGSGSITLDVLSGGAAGNPALYLANGGLSLTSTTGAINVTAKGSTTDSGAAVYQTGDGIYSAATYGLSLVSTSGPITLTASGAAGVGGLNLFGPLTLGGASTSGAITVAADRMALGNTAGSNIQTSGALTLKPYGISTSLGLGSGAGTLSLPQSYFWNGASGVVKAGLSSLTFGRTDGTGLLTLGGALSINSSATLNLHAGSYADSGSNILTVNAGAGTLNLAAHATAGNIGASGDSIDFAAGTTTVTTTGNGSAYITSAASYALGASTVGSGTLKVGAGGTATVTQSGAASAGTLVLDASGLTVTLSQAGNDFDTLNGTAGVLTLRDTDGLDVGALTATSFDLTTGGNVTSSGALSTGLLNLNLGSFDATLNYVGSNFTGGVRGTARHLTLRDDSGGISLGGSPLTLSGNLVVTSNGGAITQTGELVIGGTTTLTAGSYDITLTNASNDFTGAVNIVSARDTTLYDTNSLHLGNASVRKLTAIAGTGGGTPGAGDLYLDSGTVITASNNPNATGLQSSVVLVSGKGSSGRFINNAGANAINLTGGNGTRWVVYTNNPYINGDVLGGLTSGSFAVFNTHYPDHNSTTRPSVARGPEHTDVLNGNRYVLSMDLADIPGADPSKVTVTALDVNKTYGDGLALSAGSATSVSFASGNTVISEFSEPAPAWLGVGNLTLTSAGTATTANVGSYGVSIGGDIGINPGSGLVYQTVTPTLSPSGTSTGIYSGACSYGTCQVTLKALGSVIVGQRVLTLTPDTTGVAANKTYDGTAAGTWTTAPTFTLGNTANSDVVTLTGTATATFADKNVGTSKTVTLSGFSASSANYALPMLPTYTADITARNITISATGQNKTYDATNVATVTLAPSASAAPGTAGSGFITGDLLTYSYTGAVFDTGKNAGSTLAITVSGLSLGGADAANYTLAAATASTSANIAQRAITLTALSGSKTYDGSAVLSAPTFALDASAILGSDALSGATGNATFNNRHAGNGKTLTADLATLTLTGADAGNYTLGTGSYVGSGNIIAKTVTLTQGNVSRPYDGTAAYTLTAGDLSTFTTALGVSGDTVTAGSASFDSKHVGSGNKTLTLDSATVSDGNSGNNYALTLAGNNASTITQAALTVSTGNVIKTYDGTLTAAGSGVITVGSIFTGDSIDYSSLTTAFANKNAGSGNKTVTVGGSVMITDGNPGGEGGNYLVTLANNTTSTINTAALTVTAPTVTRNYDGTTTAAGVATASGLAAGDSVNAAATLNFDTKMAGTGKTVTASALTVKDGASANMTSNYSISYVADTASVIDRIALTLAPVSATKTYDGATNSAGAVTVTGLVSAYDTATVAQEYLLANALGAANSTLRIKSGYTILDGNSADMSGNYTITDTTTATGTINPRVVSLTGSRSYDGTTDVVAGIFTLGNLVTGETLTLSGTGTVLSKNVGTGKTVTPASLALSDSGSYLASNYTFTGGTHEADITAASLTLSTSDVTKTYSGNTTAAGTAAVTGSTLFSGDTLSGGSFAFTDPNAGSGNKTVTVSGITVNDGNGGANYTVSYASNTTSTINAKAVTLSATKTYDGSTTLGAGTVTLATGIGGEALTYSGATANSKNVADNATNYITAITLADGTGGLASNYMLPTLNQANATVTINTRTVTLSASKTYNGNSTLGAGTVTVGTGVDAETLSYSGATVSNAHVATAGKYIDAITLGDASDGSGGLAGNYALPALNLANAPATINARAVSLTGSRGYDGTADMAAGIFTLGNRVTGETLTLSGSGTVLSKNVGAGKTVTLGSLALGNGSGGLASDYTLTGGTYAADITVASLTLSISNVSKTYSGNTTAVGTATVTGGTLFSGDTLSGGSFAFTDPNAGSGNKTVTVSGITISDGNGGANYTVGYASNTTSTITPLSITVAASAASKVYGNADPALDYSLTSGALVSGDSLSGALSRVTGENVGSYAIQQGTLANSNYAITYAGAQLAITARPITVTAAAQTKVYGAADPTLTYTLEANSSGRGLVDGDSFTGTLARAAGTQVGSYAIGKSTLANGNYAITYTAADLVITPKTLTLAGSTSLSKTYDGSIAMPVGQNGYGSLLGIVGSDTLALAGAPVFSSKDAGTRAIQQGTLLLAGADAGNYTLSWTNGSGTINPAPLSVRANDAANFVTQGVTGTAAFNGLSYSGFVAGETSAVVSGTASITRTGTQTSAGTYSGALTATGLSASNYAIRYMPGDYTIVPANQLLVEVQNTSNTYGSAAAYSITSAKYLAGDGVTIAHLTGGVSISGNSITINDGSSTASFTLVPSSGTTSTAGYLNVGSYQLAASGVTENSTNFGGTLTVVGAQSVTQKALTTAATGGLSKVYDGTTAMSGLVVGLGGLVSGDAVSATGNGAYAGRNAGSNLNYAVSALQLAGADAGNYYLAGGTSFTGSNSAITPKAITASYTALDKVYDGTTVATVSGGSSGFIASDVASLTYTTAAFADRNVGAGKTVTVSGVDLTGSDAANYSVSNPTVLTTASITAKTLTLAGANGLAKTYDGTVLMPVADTGYGSPAGIVSGDTVSVAGAPVYDGTAVGSHLLQQGTVGLAGADAGNYSLSWTDGTGAITQAVLTVRANNAANFITQSVTGTQVFNDVSYSGFVNGETSAALGGAASISRIGNQTLVGTYSSVLVPSGLTATNYSFNYVAGDYTIVPASQLLVVVQNTSNSYGSAPTYAVTSAQYLASDGSTIANLTSNVSVTGNTVTITDGGSTAGFTLAQSGSSNSTAGWLKAGSYQLTASGVAENSANFGSTITVLGSQTVTQKAITASYTATDKTYDGTTAATASGSSSGVVTNDLVSFAYGAASFADRHADTGKTVTISGIRLAGDDAANYTLSANTATTTANIDAASLTLSTSNVSKTYDRTTNAAGVALVTAGTLYGGDSLAGGSFAFTDANAGSGNRTVLVSGVTVNDGNSGANYNVTYASNATSTITPKAITASFSANDKIYDGNATATVSGSSSGVIGGDTVSFSYTAAAFADANVGVGKTVSISGIGLGDAQAGNYSLAATSASTTASITARPITVTTDAKTMVYGAADPALTYQITVGSLIGGDTLSNALSRVAGGNVGSYAIQQGSLANSNYAITYVPAQFIISPVLLTLAGSSGLTKTYDGTALMPLGSSGYGGFSGVGVSGDILTLNGAPVFASADAGAQAIQQGTVALSGANAGNYSLAWTNGIGTISKAPLTVRANDDANFVTQVVAGTAVFNSVAYSGFVNGETSAVLGGAATITRSGTQTTAGTYNGVLLPAGLTAANYDISYVAGSYTIVPANQLLVTVGNAATSYGTAATYGVTGAKYLASDNTTIVDLTGNVSATGNAITINDGVYGAASFTLAPSGALYSTANLLRVGNYALGANNVVETHANFSNTLTIVGSHTVSQKAVTAAASGIGKVYDGTTAMNGVTMDLTGRAADDVVTVSGIGAFASKNAGSNVGYAISNILLGGADAGNYVLTGGTALSGSNGNIARRTLTLAWTGQDKLYDGTTVATVSATDDRIGGDVFALGATANFADPMPGTRKPVTIDGIGLSGVDAANYVLASATGAATATIQALPAIPQPSPSDPGAPGNPGGPGGTGGSDPFNPFDPFAPTDPGGTPTDPTGTPTDPTGTPTDPTGTPTDSTGTPTDPTGTPTDPKAGGPTGGPDTRPGVDGDIASSVALTLPGGVSINLSLPAGLSIEREPGTATVRFAPPGSENSGDNGTVISTTLSVIVLKGDRPPASVPGIAVTEVDGAITVSSFDGGANGALPSPGTVRNSLRIELKGGPGAGAASFSVDLTDSGIVIRPRDRLAQAMIDSLREDVIALALAETRRQFKVPLDRIKSVFIDQT